VLCDLVVEHSMDDHEVSCRSVHRNKTTYSQPNTILFRMGMLPISGSCKIAVRLSLLRPLITFRYSLDLFQALGRTLERVSFISSLDKGCWIGGQFINTVSMQLPSSKPHRREELPENACLTHLVPYHDS